MANPPRSPGRPKGVPNRASVAGRDLAMQWGPDAMREQARLAGLLRAPDGTPVPGSESDVVRLNACQYILDRAYGKATQPIAGDDDMDPLRTVMRIEFVGEEPKSEPNA